MADFVLIPGAAEAIKLLNDAGYVTVIVTNQAGIARGMFDAQAVHALHEHLRAELQAAGARVDAMYFCPHHPDFTGVCDCRKPQPGMLQQAAREHQLALKHSWLVGDTLSDIAAGQAAGCQTVLVRTGYGARMAAQAEAEGVRPQTIVDDLLSAVRWILAAQSAGRDGR